MVFASRNAGVYFTWDGGSSSFHSDHNLSALWWVVTRLPPLMPFHSGLFNLDSSFETCYESSPTYMHQKSLNTVSGHSEINVTLKSYVRPLMGCVNVAR